MDRWLAISDGATAALHALAYAASRGGLVSAKTVAKEIGVSPSYLAKLLQSLTKAGFIEASRGAAGGFSVRGEAQSISSLEVIIAIDGKLPERACLFREASCTTGTCVFKVLCAEVGARAQSVLQSTSIKDLSKSYSATR